MACAKNRARIQPLPAFIPTRLTRNDCFLLSALLFSRVRTALGAGSIAFAMASCSVSKT